MKWKEAYADNWIFPQNMTFEHLKLEILFLSLL